MGSNLVLRNISFQRFLHNVYMLRYSDYLLHIKINIHSKLKFSDYKINNWTIDMKYQLRVDRSYQ
eukprot:UN04708